MIFLVGQDSPTREARIRAVLTTEPPVAVILGVVHIEWTVRRTILALGYSPNVMPRKAFTLRHRLVYSVSSCSADYAAPKVAVLLKAAADIRAFCHYQGRPPRLAPRPLQGTRRREGKGLRAEILALDPPFSFTRPADAAGQHPVAAHFECVGTIAQV